LDATLKLARQEGLAAYLELALRLQLPLATLDTRLAEAATRCGVGLLTLPGLKTRGFLIEQT
jgi:predicted nucleic acid-binding protein